MHSLARVRAHVTRCVQAFSPLHVNSAFLAVGAYPCTRADMHNPRPKSANDEVMIAKMDHSEVAAKRLCTLLKERAG